MKKLNYFGGLALLCLVLNSCYTLRALKWWQPGLDDVHKFGSARIAASPGPFTFTPGMDNPRHQKLKTYLDTFLQRTNTNAFVIIKHDTVIYEHYGTGNADDLHPSFSVAKSFVGTLIGIAVDKGFITSTNKPIINYFPNLVKNDARMSRLTIQHVLDMRASLAFNEHKETAFGEITKLYYGRSLQQQINHLKLKAEPGGKFEYQSICTQLLAVILEKATHKKVNALLKEWLWQPMGMQSDALWSVDDNQMVKAFCCLNATALDFAKIGRLFLNKGQWQGKQIVSSAWVNATTHPDTLFNRGYKNQWWAAADYRYFADSARAVMFQQQKGIKQPIYKNKYNRYYFHNPSPEFEAEGILQQIVYVNPANGVIIVRLGNYPNKNVNFPDNFIPGLGRQL
jgi:CubicO group peptidase (beta-lactamase class C family)